MGHDHKKVCLRKHTFLSSKRYSAHDLGRTLLKIEVISQKSHVGFLKTPLKQGKRPFLPHFGLFSENRVEKLFLDFSTRFSENRPKWGKKGLLPCFRGVFRKPRWKYIFRTRNSIRTHPLPAVSSILTEKYVLKTYFLCFLASKYVLKTYFSGILTEKYVLKTYFLCLFGWKVCFENILFVSFGGKVCFENILFVSFWWKSMF